MFNLTAPDNDTRAEWAATALDVFASQTMGGPMGDQHPDDASDAVADLIANCLHYARRAGMDLQAITRQALANFEAEETEEASGEADYGGMCLDSPLAMIRKTLETVNENSEPEAMGEALATLNRLAFGKPPVFA